MLSSLKLIFNVYHQKLVCLNNTDQLNKQALQDFSSVLIKNMKDISRKEKKERKKKENYCCTRESSDFSPVEWSWSVVNLETFGQRKKFLNLFYWWIQLCTFIPQVIWKHHRKIIMIYCKWVGFEVKHCNKYLKLTWVFILIVSPQKFRIMSLSQETLTSVFKQ